MAIEMRRRKQALSKDECIEMLKKNNAGVLNLTGLDGYPYGVPVSYVYDDGTLIFHGAKSGYRVDCARRNPKVSFTVIDENHVVPEEYTTYFRSVIAFGEVEIIEDDAEKAKVCEILGRGISPNESEEHLQNEISKEMPALLMYRLKIDHMTGKMAIELVRKK